MIESPRLDLLIAEYGRTLAIALVAVGVLAIVATGWVVATPSTSTTTQQVDQETVSTETATSAVVGEDGLWEAGTELENSAVYPRSASELTISPETTVPTDDSSVIHEVRISYEAERDGSVFWTETDHEYRTDAPVDDGVATSETTIDVDDVRDRQAELEEQLAGVGSLATSIEVVVEYDTGTYADEREVASPLRVTDDAYWLEESLSDSKDHSEPATIEVQESPNATVIGGLLLVAVLSFGGAALVRGRGSIDVEAARRAVHEHRYAEWISHGSIPMWLGDDQVELDTLEDVVDVAIDTNERVVHDRRRGLFAVVNGNVVYYYSERGRWEETAWPELQLGDQSSVASDAESESSDTAPPIPGLEEDLPDPEDEDAWEQL